MTLAGKGKLECLQEVIAAKSNEENDLKSAIASWKKFTGSLVVANPSLLAQGTASIADLGERFGMNASEADSGVIASLALETAVEEGQVHGEGLDAEAWLNEEFPVISILKTAFCLEKKCEEALKNLSTVTSKKRKLFERLQKSYANLQEKRQKTLDKGIQNVMVLDPEIQEQELSKRNCRNRVRTGAKTSKKSRVWDEKFADYQPKVKRQSRLSIFQKLEVVDFALSLVKQSKNVLKSSRKKKKISSKKIRSAFRGLNLQQVCSNKFPKLGRIKVTALIKAAEEQSWRSLSEMQQKKYFQLPDSLKVALGLEKRVKGWKAIGPEKLQEVVQERGRANRWAVPGPVLQEGFPRIFKGGANVLSHEVGHRYETNQ